uniref:Solute carrier organic anion transporter family member n=1 Tax=Phallusia mammillata TaxID=59560 RepID=A0A6F9DSC7_9ASCI|nr:solute carrier organic anion transporter family member 2A1-like [Phallusia mammillata]
MTSRNVSTQSGVGSSSNKLVTTPRSNRRRSVLNLLSPRGRAEALLVLSPEDRGQDVDDGPPTKSGRSVLRFVVFLIIMHLFTSMLLFSVKTYATTMERRYGLTASIIGTIVAASDAGHLASLFPSALAASRFSRPRIIAAGGLLMSFGGFLCCAPHFFCGAYEPVPLAEDGSTNTEYVPQLCAQSEDLERTTEESISNISSHLFNLSAVPIGYDFNSVSCTKRGLEAFFIFSTFIIGFGAGPVVTLHFSYIDDFAPPSKSPLLLAVIQTFSVLGIIFSYSAAGVLGRIYVDIGRIPLANVFLKSGDVRWVGAWWLGFLVASTGALLWSLPLLCFDDADEYVLLDESCSESPEESLNHEDTDHCSSRHQRSHHRPVDYNYHSHLSHHHQSSLHHMLPARPTRYKEDTIVDEDIIHPLEHILRNGALVVSLIATIGWHFQPVMNGTFVLKYLQQEFDFSAASSSVTVGCIIWIPACLGIVLGGFLHSHYRWNEKQVSLFLVALMAIACVCYPAGCPTRHVIGLSKTSAETKSCAKACKCGDAIFNLDPVCGADGRTYATPCLAGCENVIKMDQETVYDGCRCVGLINDSVFVWNDSNALVAADGSCSSTCDRLQLILFLVNFVIRVLVLSMTYVPYGVFLMRSVRPADKAVAIAAKEIFGKLLGEIPGSILAGRLFDSCCMVWSKDTAGGCQLYDLETLRIRFWLLNFVPSLCAVSAFLLSIVLLQRPNKVLLPTILIHPPEEDDSPRERPRDPPPTKQTNH